VLCCMMGNEEMIRHGVMDGAGTALLRLEQGLECMSCPRCPEKGARIMPESWSRESFGQSTSDRGCVQRRH